MRLLLAAALLGSFSAQGWAGGFSSSANGTTVGQFLELGVGARALTMGQAYTAVADEASALYWNPAAMTQLPGRSLTLMHDSYLASSSFDYGAYAQPLGKNAAVGASFQYFSAGSITQTDASASSVGTFSPHDLALTFGGAYKLEDSGFSLGLGAKFIQSTVLTSAQTEALDVGLLSPAYLNNRLKFAFAMSNMGPSLKFDQLDENLPLTFKLGSTYALSADWVASMDLGLPRGGSPWVGLGTEYRVPISGPWKFAGRAGFNSQTFGDITGFTGVSFGVGLSYYKARLDYGFVPFGGLGQAQIVSLSYTF